MTGLASDVEALARTLRELGWDEAGGMAGLYEVWSPPGGGSELILPLAIDRADFGLLYDRALEQLSHIGGASAVGLFEALHLGTQGALELSRWQKESGLPGGVIPWMIGERHFQAVRDTLGAAAKSAKSIQRVHGRGGSYLAKAFLGEVLMGQTQVGSFIVTAHIPAAYQIPASSSAAAKIRAHEAGAETVSSLQILDRLERSLSAAAESVAEYKRSPNLGIFDEVVREGVSFELVRALAELSRDGDCAVSLERGADLVNPARTSEYAFSALDAPIFDRVAVRFIQDEQLREVVLVGEVTLLKRDHETGGLVRDIRLEIVDGPVRKVRVRLSHDEYELAVEAHAREKRLRVRGLLERDGRYFWIHSPQEVGIAEEPGSGLPRATSEQSPLF